MCKAVMMIFISICLCRYSMAASVRNVPGDYATIQLAINASVDGDTVRVAEGTYSGPGFARLNFKGKQISVVSENGPETCIIDSPGSKWGVVFESGESENSVLNGFTFRNIDGPCVLIDGTSPVITNCRLADSEHGARIESLGETFSHPRFFDCEFSGNAGVGLTAYFGRNLTVNNCVLTRNKCGGLSLYSCRDQVTINNCLITHNSIGGGISTSGTETLVTHCTIVDNTAAQRGGGISGACDSHTVVANCVIWGNRAEEGGNQICLSYSRWEYHGQVVECNGTMYIHHSSVPNTPEDIETDNAWYLSSGPGMTYQNPLLTFGPGGDYFLSQTDTQDYETSPCTDAAENTAANTCIDVFDGNVCLNTLTTRVDGEPDAGMADIGYHYACDSEYRFLRARIRMPYRHYSPGMMCFCDAYIIHPGDSVISDCCLFVLLDVMGEYVFAPSFSGWDCYHLDIVPGTSTLAVLPEFIWPDNCGTMTGIRWITGITNAGITELIGEPGTFDFGW